MRTSHFSYAPDSSGADAEDVDDESGEATVRQRWQKEKQGGTE
jgi:hypothetical protein